MPSAKKPSEAALKLPVGVFAQGKSVAWIVVPAVAELMNVRGVHNALHLVPAKRGHSATGQSTGVPVSDNDNFDSESRVASALDRLELAQRLGLDFRFHLLPEPQTRAQDHHREHDDTGLEVAGDQGDHGQGGQHGVERMLEGVPKQEGPRRRFLAGELVRAELLQPMLKQEWPSPAGGKPLHSPIFGIRVHSCLSVVELRFFGLRTGAVRLGGGASAFRYGAGWPMTRKKRRPPWTPEGHSVSGNWPGRLVSSVSGCARSAPP